MLKIFNFDNQLMNSKLSNKILSKFRLKLLKISIPIDFPVLLNTSCSALNIFGANELNLIMFMIYLRELSIIYVRHTEYL